MYIHTHTLYMCVHDTPYFFVSFVCNFYLTYLLSSSFLLFSSCHFPCIVLPSYSKSLLLSALLTPHVTDDSQNSLLECRFRCAKCLLSSLLKHPTTTSKSLKLNLLYFQICSFLFFTCFNECNWPRLFLMSPFSPSVNYSIPIEWPS